MIESVKVFKAIGDETRIKILILLSKKNICAKAIAKHLQISEAAVSQHIKILKEVDLIVGYKRGYHVIYDLNKKVLEKAIEFINVLITDDICSIDNKFNVSLESFHALQCEKNCKVVKKCCKERLKEEE